MGLGFGAHLDRVGRRARAARAEDGGAVDLVRVRVRVRAGVRVRKTVVPST